MAAAPGPRLRVHADFPSAHEYVYILRPRSAQVDVVAAESHEQADRFRTLAATQNPTNNVFISSAKPGPTTLSGDHITFHLRAPETLY